MKIIAVIGQERWVMEYSKSGFTVKLIDVSENLWIKEWQQLPPI
jgi:hypothetical protein